MSPRHGYRRPDPALLEDLRARIRGLERHAPASGAGPGVLALGAPEIDAALPWGGLPGARLHEIIGGGGGAAGGFCAALLGRLAGAAGTVLWCRQGGGLHGPGLAALGLDPGRLIVVRARAQADVPWAMEEGLRSGALAAVLGEAAGLAPTVPRRLQLAAEAGGVTALLLRPARTRPAPGPATTRWRVSAAPSVVADTEAGVGVPRWRVDLLRCRGGTPGSWLVEWHDGKTGGFAVAATLRDRPAEPAAEHGEARLAV